jgi:DNA-binding NarL/FixJ family response regulator
VISLVLADDQALVRAGLRLILEAQHDFEVVGEADDGREAVELARSLRPDVVLMDVRMPVLDGIAATRIVVEHELAGRVLVLTTIDEDRIVYDAMRAGASGFLLKTAPPAQLVAAVRTVLEGDALLAPTVTRRLIEDFTSRPPPDQGVPERLAVLTERELEVLRLIAAGRSNAEIARELFLSGATVKTHVNRVFAKLDVRDRVEVVVLAYETGLVRPGDPAA